MHHLRTRPPAEGVQDSGSGRVPRYPPRRTSLMGRSR